MSAFAKNMLLYAVEVVVALVVGTVVGVGVRWLIGGGEIDRDAITLCVTATSGAIIFLTVIGAFPVGKFPVSDKKNP